MLLDKIKIINEIRKLIALSSDQSYNKDSLRKYISEGSRMIPESATE